MSIVLDPTTILNLILATAIAILGVWVYSSKKERRLSLYVATGFALFAVSHALTLLGYGDVQAAIIPLRALGYLSVFAGLLLLFRAKVAPLHEESEREKLPAR